MILAEASEKAKCKQIPSKANNHHFEYGLEDGAELMPLTQPSLINREQLFKCFHDDS